MASQQRFVNIVPHVKIKKEIIEDEDEETILCRICNKAFSNEMALCNHARMEHFEAFASGAPLAAEPEVKPVPVKKPREVPMARTSLMSLASEDVSYIIIKQPDWTGVKPRERKRKSEKVEKEKAEKVAAVRKDREKEAEPITGPFECLQPSTLVADGTCHQIFFSCCEYSVHFRDEHTRRRKGLRCQVCEKPLASGGEETSPYPCEVCGMGFETNKQLSNHMATDHVKLKPFECNVCHKRFTQQGGVQQHMRMHTGDRPFPCIFCSKAFTQKSGLDQHLRIHTKVKPYRCVICSKTFCQSVHLKQHMRTHTNVSPFQCGICSKRFKQSSHLNYHLRNHNPANMSEEQRVEYNKLIQMMNGDTVGDKVICMLGEDHNMQLVEVDGSEEVVVDMSGEQALAERSIQGEGEGEGEGGEGDGGYILGDAGGGDVWSVRLVES